MKSLLHVVLPAILIAVSSATRADTISIIPAQPRYLEPVYVRITPDPRTHIQGAQVGMATTGIEVQYQAVRDLPPSGSFDVMLGRLPAGTYFLVVNGLLGDRATTQFTVGTAPVPGQFERAPAVNYTDLWWNPEESGWGLSIVQGPTNLIFATWFVYDTVGNPTWYTLQPGNWIGGKNYSGPIYKTSGPWVGGVFDSNAVTETVVGEGYLSFKDSQHGTFSYKIEGISGESISGFAVKEITRQPIE